MLYKGIYIYIWPQNGMPQMLIKFPPICGLRILRWLMIKSNKADSKEQVLIERLFEFFFINISKLISWYVRYSS